MINSNLKIDKFETEKSPIINGNEVTFIFKGKAKKVYLAGEYNQWELEDAMTKLDKEDIWYIDKHFPANARLDYKYIVDGSWITDPLNENITTVSAGNVNSTLIMPEYSSRYQEIINSQVPRGTVINNVKFQSDYMNCEMNYHIYLPNGCEKENVTHVLYAMDGSDYLNHGKINLVLDYLIHRGEIPPIIAVLADPNDRNKEYTINRSYYSYTIKELIPYVEANYLNLKNNPERSIIGVSWGGLTAIYLAANAPGTFSRLLSQSGSFWPKDWIIFDMVSKADISNIRFCLQTGTIQDTEEMNDEMAKLLEDKQCELEYVKYAESHSWFNWKGHLDAGLKTVYS